MIVTMMSPMIEMMMTLIITGCFLDALSSLDFRLSVTESVSDLPFFFFKYSVNQGIHVQNWEEQLKEHPLSWFILHFYTDT